MIQDPNRAGAWGCSGLPVVRIAPRFAIINLVKNLDLHPWDVDAREAVEIQKALASRVSVEDELASTPRCVAGVDISPPDALGYAVGAVVVAEFPSLQVTEVRVYRAKLTFPYVPGLLSFREAPLMLGALEALSATPDVILVDGHGLAHPRRFGLACHLGLLTDTPTIGCAKSILRGRTEGTPAPEAGSHVPLVHNGDVVGSAVRTRGSVNPIYVSVGHKLSLERAIELTLGCSRGYRMPEPTRLAHLAAAGRIAPGEAGAHPGLGSRRAPSRNR